MVLAWLLEYLPQKAGQQFTLCGVSIHFQSGITVWAICNLSESMPKQLLNACVCWPMAVHFALWWPFALRNAAILHNNLPVLEDSMSNQELFSSIHVGSNMKHAYTFGCPVFFLQNALASGNQLPRWSPCACFGLNLGPHLMHARNIYLVLNLITGCISPQYHCCFNNFFETTRHSRPDISGSIYWQQLANLDHTKMILSEVSAPTQHSSMSLETPSEDTHTTSKSLLARPTYGITLDNYSISGGKTLVKENTHPSCKSQTSHQAEGVTPVAPAVTPGTSQCGQVCTCHKEWQNLYPNRISLDANMHYMALQSTIGKTVKDLFHSSHLQLQERMRNPIAFNTKMMVDIMYLQQVLIQPDKWISPSSYQGSKLTCGLQQMDTQEKKWSPWWHSDSAIYMVTPIQAWSHNKQSQVSQGKIEPLWRKAGVWNELHWDMSTGCRMVCH